MKPAPFDYHAPTSLAEALEILATHRDDAKALAGGQSLVPMLALRLTRFDHLIDLQRIDELVGVSQDIGSLVLGAMTTQASIGADADVARLAPLLHRATPLIGHHQIRNRGTLGGSLCHADPASEYPAVALALGAELEVVSASGTRRVPASGFCEGTWTTCLDADELLASVRIPQWHGRVGSAIDEVARRHGDFALVGAAAAVSVDDDDRVQRVGLGLFGVASTPFDAGALTQLEGRKAGELGDEQLREIGAMVAASLDPPADVHATATYRKRVAGRIVPRVLRAAIEEATNGGA